VQILAGRLSNIWPVSTIQKVLAVAANASTWPRQLKSDMHASETPLHYCTHGDSRPPQSQKEGQKSDKENARTRTNPEKSQVLSILHTFSFSVLSHRSHQFTRMDSPATNPEMIHVVCKADNRQHAVVNIPSSLEELPASSLRARPILLGLTSNNLSYARGGDILHWYAACFYIFCAH
jgi:hypothetical protein